MSLTKRTYTDILGNTLVSTGSVTGATTKLTMVFTANNTLWGVQSTINVYVDGTKVTCTWTVGSAGHDQCLCRRHEGDLYMDDQ